MKTSINAFFKFVWAHIGHCRRCARLSFIYAITTIVAAIASSFILPRMATVLIAICAVALTALWLTHIAAYSLKSLARRTEAPPRDAPKASRRKFFADFAKLSAVIAIGSMVPRMAAACGSCTVGCMQYCGGANNCASGDGSTACPCECN